MRYSDLRRYFFDICPILVTAFFIITLTLICSTRWLIALVQLPAWGLLIWWLFAKEEYYMDRKPYVFETPDRPFKKE